MTRLYSSHDIGDSDSTRVTLKKMVTRLESRFSQNDSTRVTVIDSSHSHWLESESFLQSHWVPGGQTQFVCAQRNEDFWLKWWSRLGEIFYFDCLVVLCCSLRIKCPQLALRQTRDFAFTEGSAGAQYIDTLLWFNVIFAYRDYGSGSHTVTLWLFQISIKWFKFFRFKSNQNSIARYNANTETESCLNPNSSHCY